MEHCCVIHGLILQPDAICWQDWQHVTQERILEQPSSCCVQEGHHNGPHGSVKRVQDSLHMVPMAPEEIARAQALCKHSSCA